MFTFEIGVLCIKPFHDKHRRIPISVYSCAAINLFFPLFCMEKRDWGFNLFKGHWLLALNEALGYCVCLGFVTLERVFVLLSQTYVNWIDWGAETLPRLLTHFAHTRNL